MFDSESARLARFSEAVRESSLKRLHLVPERTENWRPTHEGMSFADIAQHLINADNWLFKMLDLKNLKPIVGKPGLVEVTHRSQYLKLLEELRQIGEHRSQLIENMEPAQLSVMIFDERFGQEVSIWWIIVRGNLDHEIHHRGQIATYLRILGRSNLPV
ncbi:MAG: DinB family protein [candidate division Zixibacteria bacterium]|nr:DinB family protein [candidate division Zixibacteria bacterium]